MHRQVSPWDTPGITQRLRELHRLKGEAELSMTEIAEQLNREFKTDFSRNSIIGRCHRINLARRPSVFNVHHAKRRQEKMIPINRRVRVDAPIVPEIEVADITTGALTILQLRNGVCRWPLGAVEDKPQYLYCGKPAPIECPYCKTHFERARGRMPARVA